GGFPQKRFELLTKIYNNITLRSNVFAVWLTVGFFEVVDESVMPPTLGAEIGLSENRQVRHRRLAIVDRTNLMTPDPTPDQVAGLVPPLQLKLAQAVPSIVGQQLKLNAVSWNITGNAQGQGLVNVTSKIKPGMKLRIDAALPTDEILNVRTVDYLQG